MENAENAHRYAFESFSFDAANGELRGPDRTVKLRPQAALALDLLLSRKGEVVSRDELRKALWPDERVVMFEASIAAVIRELRRALGENSKAPRFIETIPKRGYRFAMGSVEAEREAVAGKDSPLPKSNRRGGFLRVSEGLVLALMTLLMGGAAQLQPSSRATPDAAPVTVAVLPFENLTRLPDGKILSETLPRDVAGWLGGMAPERLHVVDRSGAEKAGGVASSHADFLVVGSVREDGDAAVVFAEMLGGADGRFVWSEDYRRDAENPGLTAREVAARIADRVASKSLSRWQNGFAPATEEAAAAGAFRRGAEAYARLSEEGAPEAVKAFREATELDPGFSEAHAHLAAALIRWPGPRVTAERVEQARAAAQTSIELVPTNAVGHRVLGEIALYYDRDWSLAGSRLERSVELSPANASSHHSYAAWLSARGRHSDALREIDLAAALDPGSVAISIDVMFFHYYARNFPGTVRAAERLKHLWPGNGISPLFIVLSGLATGDVAAAAAEARARLRHNGATTAAGQALTALPDSEVLKSYWEGSLRYASERSGDPAMLALFSVQLGRLDAANSALQSALASRDFSYYLPYLGVSPAFDRMCGHPGFERILRRLRQQALDSDTDLARCAAAIAASARSRDIT